MAKASFSVPQQLYSAGTREIELPNLTSDDLGVKISLTRVAWQDTGSPVIIGSIDASNDNGATRFNLTEFNYNGGAMTDRLGNPVNACGPTVYWPEKAVNGVLVPQRPGRVWATLTNTVPLTTAITLTGA